MKTGIPFSRANANNAKTPKAWLVTIAGAVLLLGVGLWAILRSAPSETASHSPVPAGQLQADMRTVAAAFRYLCEADSSLIGTSGATGFASSSFVLQSLDSRLERADYPSNQSEFPVEPITNRPARS